MKLALLMLAVLAAFGQEQPKTTTLESHDIAVVGPTTVVVEAGESEPKFFKPTNDNAFIFIESPTQRFGWTGKQYEDFELRYPGVYESTAWSMVEPAQPYLKLKSAPVNDYLEIVITGVGEYVIRGDGFGYRTVPKNVLVYFAKTNPRVSPDLRRQVLYWVGKSK